MTDMEAAFQRRAFPYIDTLWLGISQFLEMYLEEAIRCRQMCLYKEDHSSIISKGKRLEATYVSSNRGVYK